MWIKNNLDLYVDNVSEQATSFDTVDWQEDSFWSYVATWSKDVAMSTDFDEGFTTCTVYLT